LFLSGLTGEEQVDLFTGARQAVGAVLRNRRLVLDVNIAPASVQDLQIPARYAAVGDLVPLYLAFKDLGGNGVVLADPTVVADASAFADARHPVDVLDFIALHSIYLAVLQALAAARVTPLRAARAAAVQTVYDAALLAAAPLVPGARPVVAVDADWLNPGAGVAQAIHAAAGQLSFASANTLVWHGLKHLLAGQLLPALPADWTRLFTDYLVEARARITDAVPGTVTWSVNQLGTSRTFYWGVLNQDITMVAVDSAGHAWITTHYRPGRL
jgi:hypothetical protein